jgi:hypothetical protein
MKLNENQQAVVKDRLGADPLPEEHPSYPALSQAFGDHSFYVSDQGLLVFQQVPEQPEVARLVLVAAWTDDSKSELGAIEPQVSDITVDFSNGAAPMSDKPGPNGAA